MANEPLRCSKRLAKGDSEIQGVTNTKIKQRKQETTNPLFQTANEDGRQFDKTRCNWATKFSGSSSSTYVTYHDEEWGVPLHDDRALFELLILEGAQAGLSWSTVLNKRERYREVFDGFCIEKVASYDSSKREELLNDPGIIRHKGKIDSAINNAKLVLLVQEEFGTFDKYLWRFVDGKPIKNSHVSLSDVPAKTRESEALSKDLISRGFKFVGPTIMYAFMQGCGMVNDHLIQCFRHTELKHQQP